MGLDILVCMQERRNIYTELQWEEKGGKVTLNWFLARLFENRVLRTVLQPIRESSGRREKIVQ
jgi:hypothetical protein